MSIAYVLLSISRYLSCDFYTAEKVLTYGARVNGKFYTACIADTDGEETLLILENGKLVYEK